MEIIGNSRNVGKKIDEARKTIHNLYGLEITDMAKVQPDTDKITESRWVKTSFAVEHESDQRSIVNILEDIGIQACIHLQSVLLEIKSR